MTQDPSAAPPAISPADPDMTARSYQLYFGSGYYDRRYPRPNATIMRRLHKMLTPEAALLDFGCGSGRYLLSLQGRLARAAGYDISPAALASLRARAELQSWGDLAVLGPRPQALTDYLAAHGQVDLVICLFGVLAHITDPGARAGALAQMRGALKPGRGRLLISVPNIARRFRHEQKLAQGGPPGRVAYERRVHGQPIPLGYQLYDASRLRQELRDAGFTPLRIGVESTLPESLIARSRMAGWLDAALTPFCPLRWGYGLYAEAAC